MNKKNIKLIIIVVTIVICVVYLKNKVTYTSYESNVDATTSSTIANWNIKINNKTLTKTDTNPIASDDITWTNTHANNSKVAPNSSGIYNIEIDPTTTNVAIKYELEVIDKSVDATKILTLTSINSDLIKTGIDTYTGIITLNDINNKIKKTITLNLKWLSDDNNDSNVEATSSTDFLELEFCAYQYRGEQIVEYGG